MNSLASRQNVESQSRKHAKYMYIQRDEEGSLKLVLVELAGPCSIVLLNARSEGMRAHLKQLLWWQSGRSSRRRVATTDLRMEADQVDCT